MSISLIANSGIQFHNVKVNLGEASPAMKTRFEYCELMEEDEFENKEFLFVFPYFFSKLQKYIRRDLINESAISANGQVNEEKILKDNIEILGENQITSINARDSINIFEGVWLPLPYFRKSTYSDELHPGPETWSRMLLSRITSSEDAENGKYTHIAVLAFDTKYSDESSTINSISYLTPTFKDVDGTIFRCESNEERQLLLLGKQWVDSWLKAETGRKREIIEKRFSIESPIGSGHLVLPEFIHVGLYMTFLKSLASANTFPEVSLHKSYLDDPKEVKEPYKQDKSIEVDLVLDVGNSRTCGLVVESSKGGSSVLTITDAKPLMIRDLTSPYRSSSDPFEMKLTFAHARFGEESASELSGNPAGFKWPSLVRVGKEASDLAVIFDTGESSSVFSSPKRYLWDIQKREFPWTHVPTQNEPFAKTALYGMAVLFTEDGVRLGKKEGTLNKVGDRIPIAAMNPYFSHSSLMTFALAEIILQAVSYINSYDYRCEREHPTMQRKLKRVVLTCPTAMLKTEKTLLREYADDAIEALKESFGTHLFHEHLEIIPSVKETGKIESDTIPDDLSQMDQLDRRTLRTEWGFDEATCSQITFVYSEIMHRFTKDNAKLYIDTVGRIREDAVYKNQKSVRIASVDIGGGTTDLMICSYQLDPNANVPVIVPDPHFWEGFNLAGDNILKRVIEQILLPQIASAARNQGTINTSQLMNRLFGAYYGGESHKDRMMKKYFVSQIAAPIAYGILQHATDNISNEERSFDSFFINYNSPNPSLIDHLNESFRAGGASTFDIRALSWSLDHVTTNEVVKSVIEKMLKDLCGVIAQYNCDYVLLSGKPATLPVIKAIFLKYLPTTPDRIIQMGNYRVGSWYPFAKNGVIKDPKTCVAVGASIALMSGTLLRLEGFRMNRELLANKVVSTAEYIGIYDENSARIKSEAILLDDVNDTNSLSFDGTVFLGMKQMNTDAWIASAMYKLSFSSRDNAKDMNSRLPFEVLIERDKKNKEGLTIKKVLDKNNHPVDVKCVCLTLQTLTDEYGYWLDTGVFKIDLFD